MASREASRIERAHTIRHFGSYTNGQHSFDMVTLLLELQPDASRDLILAVVHHDLSERWIGDTPFPAKLESHSLNESLNGLGRRVDEKMGWSHELSWMDNRWLQIIDRLEFFLWADDQVNMGNRALEDVCKKALSSIFALGAPAAVHEFLEDYKWQRTSDTLPS